MEISAFVKVIPKIFVDLTKPVDTKVLRKTLLIYFVMVQYQSIKVSLSKEQSPLIVMPT